MSASEPVWNVSCSNSNVWKSLPAPDAWSASLSAVALVLAAAVVTANLIMLLVLTDGRYVGVTAVAPRLLLVALGGHGLVFGLALLAPAAFTAVFPCWPMGDALCKGQAFAYGFLRLHFACLMIAMAADRLMSFEAAKPRPGPRPRRPPGLGRTTTLAVSLSATVAIAVFFCKMVLVDRRVFFDRASTIRICRPLWSSTLLRLGWSAGFYFVPTTAFMYCYGSLFHGQHALALRSIPLAACDVHVSSLAANYGLTRAAAAAALVFIVLVTPAAITEFIADSTGIKFWTPWTVLVQLAGCCFPLASPVALVLFDERFRTALKAYLLHVVLGRPVSSARSCCGPTAACPASHADHSMAATPAKANTPRKAYTPTLIYPLNAHSLPRSARLGQHQREPY